MIFTSYLIPFHHLFFILFPILRCQYFYTTPSNDLAYYTSLDSGAHIIDDHHVNPDNISAYYSNHQENTIIATTHSHQKGPQRRKLLKSNIGSTWLHGHGDIHGGGHGGGHAGWHGNGEWTGNGFYGGGLNGWEGLSGGGLNGWEGLSGGGLSGWEGIGYHGGGGTHHSMGAEFSVMAHGERLFEHNPNISDQRLIAENNARHH